MADSNKIEKGAGSGVVEAAQDAKRSSKKYVKDFYYEHYLRVKLPPRYFMHGVIYSLFASFMLWGLSGFVLGRLYPLLFFEIWALYPALCVILFVKSNLGWGKGAVRTASVIAPDRAYRFEMAERPVDLRNYLGQKPNGNLFICGTSGEGKSFLMRYMLEQMRMQKIVFNFKPDDEYLRLGYLIVDMSKALPNPFNDTEAFVNAFLITFPIAEIGITAQYIPIMLREIAAKSTSWESFRGNLRTIASKTKDRIQMSALLYIEEHAKALLGDGTNVIEIGDNDLIMDFSTLGNDDAKTFYAELLLRMLWKMMASGKTQKMLLCIDEAHRLIRRFDKYGSIYSEISREIRAFGMLWASSQNFTDMGDDVRNQFATQLCFNTTHPDDLRALELADGKLSWAASSMPLHFFTDARYEWVHELVPEFILRYTPVDRPRAYFNGVMQKGEAEGEPERRIDASSLDYWSEIKLALRDLGVARCGKIAAFIAKKYGLDSITVKLKVMQTLKKMVNCSEINMVRLMTKSNAYSAYYNSGSGSQALHRYMQSFVVSVLALHGVKVTKEAVSGTSAADVETKAFDIEVETGLKKHTDDLKVRMAKSGKRTVIVVPNSSIAESYIAYGIKGAIVSTLADFEQLLIRELIRM
jgi:hypothetical protein